MASESLTPPPSSGSPAKYLVILLLLVGGGLGVYLATRGNEEPKPAPLPEVKNAERPTALSNDTVQIPIDEEEEDAGEPEKTPEGTTKKPRPAGDLWECQGDIAAADVMRVVGPNQNAVRSCYERALRNNNQLQGSISLGVRVSADGKVSHTRVTGNLREPEVLKCIQNIAKGWAFTAPRGGTCAVFNAPFTFTPKN